MHHGGDDGAGEEVGGHHGEGDGHGEGGEEVLGGPGEEDDGDEDDTDGEGGDEGRGGDLLGGVQDGADERLLFRHVAVGVFDFDGCVVHEDADGQGEAAKGHDVDGLAEGGEDDEGGGDGEGDGGTDDEGGTPGAEEEQDHEAGEGGGDDGFAGDLGDGVADEDGLIEERSDGEGGWQARLDAREGLFDPVDDVQSAGFTVFEDGEESGALAVLADDVGLDGEAFLDLGDVLDEDDGAVGGADGEVVEGGDLAGRGVELDDVLAVSHAGGAGGEDEILLGDGGGDVGGG